MDDAAAPPPAHLEDRPGPPVRRGVPRPGGLPLRACSFRHPLCVHAPARTRPPELLGTLASAERAWDVATGALDLPPPDADIATRAYDIYLVDAADVPGETALSERDARGGFDRASAFTRIDRRLEGCARDRVLARELLRAILFRVSPAIDDGSARAQTTSLAELIAPCAALETELFQSHPERAFVDAWPEAPRDIGERFGEGAARIYDDLDATFGVEPGGVVRALWALSPTVTPLGAWSWNNEPDTFDVLRVSFKNALSTGSTIDDLYRELAVMRAHGGARGARVRIDWSIDWPDHPRRLASPSPIAPTGASYVLVHHDGAPAGARLRIESAWEQHAKMRWAVVKLDARGEEMGHIAVPTSERATETQMTVVDLEGVASVLLVCVNAGDPAYPFDPDDEVWEPHGWLLTVASEP